jgi:hypothetical protein
MSKTCYSDGRKTKIMLVQKFLERLSLRKPRHKEGVFSVTLKEIGFEHGLNGKGPRSDSALLRATLNV